MESGCPSGGGIKNGHIRYPSYGGTQKEKNRVVQGVTSGLFTGSNLTQDGCNTKHAHLTNVKHIIKHNPKVTSFGIALVKNGK